MNAFVTEILSRVVEAAVVGIIGYLLIIRDRLTKLETRAEVTVSNSGSIVDHEVRLAVIESVIMVLKEAAPALERTAAKVETLLEVALKRLDLLEAHLYKISHESS